MTTPDPLDAFILAATGALGLKVEKSWMRAVRGNLRVTLDQAALVAEFALPDDAEPAPVFEPEAATWTRTGLPPARSQPPLPTAGPARAR